MADRIRVLPDPVANQIAAGEVVNRPSSVVKEMMENSVDAGSTSVTVNFRDGGKECIQVIDDGCGMSVNDARLAFDRHATSKIKNVDDIYALLTFGFRGEALGSIASVAEVELKTRPHNEELGTVVRMAGGNFVSQKPVNCPAGTQFLVKNLFYNVPARRKFLDKSSTEARHIIAEYQRVALCNPSIAFTLYDSDSLISKLPASSLRQRIVGVIGKNIAKNLLEVSADTSIIKIEGFVGRPASSKQNNREQFLFVNGRYFKSPYFHKAVVSSYDKLIPSNTQPSYFLYLTIDPERIDVNVHPQKTEVKFSDGSDIWQIINAAVRETLAKSGAVPGMDFELDESIEIPVMKERTYVKPPTINANPEFNPFLRYEEGGQAARTTHTATGANERREGSINLNTEDLAGMVSVDSSFNGYDETVLEYIRGDETQQEQLELDTGMRVDGALRLSHRYYATTLEGNLVIIDAPRAYEAIRFDQYITMLTNGSSASQQLLFPESIVMSGDDIALVNEYRDELSSYGFDLETSGNEVVIKGVPAELVSVPAGEVIYELLDSFREDTGKSTEIKRRKAAATLAKAASRGFRTGSIDNLAEFTFQLLGSSNHSYTPSGLPVMTVIGEDDIYKRLNPK